MRPRAPRLRSTEQAAVKAYDAAMGKNTTQFVAGAGIQRMKEMLALMAVRLGSKIGGQRVARLMSAGQASKAAAYILFGGPIGARVLAEACLPMEALTAYIRLLQACGDLWNKEPRK